MKRSIALTGYHLARHARKLTLFVVATLVLSLAIALLAMPYTQVTVMEITDEGTMATTQVNAGMSLYADPGNFTSPSLFSWVVTISALWLVGRERKFMVSMSVTRLEVLISSFFYLVVLSCLMTAAYYLTTVVGSAAMWLAGFKIRAGWDLNVLFTGGSDQFPQHLILLLSQMIAWGGMYTLVGYLFLRWWKVILIGYVSLIALAIVLGTQVQVMNYLANLRPYLEDFFNWLLDVAIPAILRFNTESKATVLVGRNLLAAVAAVALSYPVMRSIPVVK